LEKVGECLEKPGKTMVHRRLPQSKCSHREFKLIKSMSKPHATGLVIGMAAPLDLPLSRLSHFPALQVCALLDSDLGFAGKTRTHKDKAFHTHTHTRTLMSHVKEN